MKIAAARDVLRMVGPSRVAREVVPWLVRRRYVFYGLTLPGPERPAPRDIALGVATEQDLAHLVRIRPGVYTLPQLRERVRDGHLPFIARRRDAVVHIRWVFTTTVYVPYLRHRLALEDGDVLLDEIYTPPEWRRKGVEVAVAAAMPQVLHQMGYRRILGATASWNLVPQHMARTCGYDRLGSGGYWTLPGLRREWWDGAVALRPDGTLLIGRPPGP